VRKKVLHVGPALTRGGMGRTIQRLHRNPPTDWDSDFVQTHADGGLLAILVAWIKGKKEFLRKLKEKPDLIHVHSATKASWYRKRKIIQQATKMNIPTIVHLHSGSFDKFGKGWVGRDIARVLSLDGVHPVVLSSYWKEWLQPMVTNEVRIIPNPYRESIIPISPKSRDIRMLIMVGRPSPVKGHELAVNAVQQLRNEGYDIRLHLAGTNQNDLPRKLRFLNGTIAEGWIEDHKLDELMSQAGFLLMPSEHEGMPLSLLDALASGLPVIVSEACSSFVDYGGVVVEKRNIETWKETIRQQINDQKGWEKMSINSHKDVEGLDPESDNRRWTEIYNRIVNLDATISQ